MTTESFLAGAHLKTHTHISTHTHIPNTKEVLAAEAERSTYHSCTETMSAEGGLR